MRFELSYSIPRASKPNINFEIKELYNLDKGILGIFGQSGTGKTSLLKALAGLIPNASYSINVNDHDYHNIAAVNNPCAYTGADSVLFDHTNVLGNLRLVIKHSKSSSNRPLGLHQVISLCAIEHLLEQPIVALSSGEKQRVIFARALLSGKPVILLDEAFSALDWSARVYFISLIKILKRQHNILFILVSHSLKELALACNDIWVLREGKFVVQADVNTALDTIILGDAMFQVDSHSKLVESKQNADQDTPLEGANYHQNLPIIEHCEALFSVLNLSYIQKDELDEQLEIWQLPAFKQAPAQQIIKRCSIDKMATLGSKDILQLSKSIIIDADKISLTYEKHMQLSMLNCVEVTVVGIDQVSNKGNSQLRSGVVVKLSANGQMIRSLISKRSFVHMQIKMGDNLFAIFKAL